jgi:hypothetical protein
MPMLTELKEQAKAVVPWVVLNGRQSQGYASKADELYYGGAAGGGKTQLLIGLALIDHQDSLILRRRAVDAKSLSKTLKALNYGSWKYSGSGGELRTPEGQTIEVGGCEHEDDRDKYQGQPHDFIGFDELPTFTESQYTFIIGWNRPLDPRAHPNQRCRVVGAGNPPTSPEGEWVLRRWRAWLDPTAGKLAQSGELRWYTTIAGDEVECENGNPINFKGTIYVPRSRTFIPARLEDNPDLMRTGYAATLEAMPEPLRSQLRYGDMLAVRQDDRWQLIPTKWAVEAQRRWVEREKAGFGELSALGCDVAMEGADWTVIAPRHGATIAPLVKRKGKDTPDGQSVVALILGAGGGAVPVNIDAIGIGKSALDVARGSGLTTAKPVIASAKAHWRDPKIATLKFANLRAAMMWKVRTLLDPEGPPETRLALPPDRELLADLTAPKYELRSEGIAVESKEKIRERIGRSTDAGDAVALACWETGSVAFAFG